MNDHLGNVRAVSGALGEAGQIYNDINSGVSGYIGSGSETTLPAAYLQYIVFDTNRNPTGQKGFFRVSTASNMTKAKVSMPQITIEQPGFIYIFVYNRSNSSNWVYFDELLVTHVHSSVVAGADYYPFGLVMNGREITDEPYRWGYQGQYAQENDSTGWNEFQLRMYDARFGRWLSVDPYGQFWSPYVGMGNAPNMGTDPDGGLFGLGPVASGALIGAAVGTAAGLIFDPDHWYLWTAGGAGLGALGGAVYNSSTYNLTGIGRTGKGGGRIAKSSGSTGSAGGGINVPAINFPSIATATWESILRFERGEYHRPDDFPTWDMVTNRRIRELHPRLGIAARQFINTVEGELGIQLRITQGYRSIAEQDALYAQGRTAPGEIVTNARGGQSYHNYGLALM